MAQIKAKRDLAILLWPDGRSYAVGDRQSTSIAEAANIPGHSKLDVRLTVWPTQQAASAFDTYDTERAYRVAEDGIPMITEDCFARIVE